MCRPDRVVLHVTSDEERLESVEKIPDAGVTVLRNGIVIPGMNGRKRLDQDELRLMFIGRMHPIKGIENLLRALTQLKSRVRLSLCGEGEAEYEAHLRALVKDLGLSETVSFCGRVDGEVKEQQFAQADLCIAPSFKEGFCTVVLESLARGVPVIAGHGTPWQAVERQRCGLWVDNTPEVLAAAIDKAATMPLVEMGLRGRAWMERDFSWTLVAKETVELYRTLIGSGEVSGHEVAHTQAA
jgi:glycosyltransferase involved in cell wall biosynthesis